MVQTDTQARHDKKDPRVPTAITRIRERGLGVLHPNAAAGARRYKVVASRERVHTNNLCIPTSRGTVET
jgi:hypothetical protein